MGDAQSLSCTPGGEPYDLSVERPVRELKDFRKVFLEPGESRSMSIPLDDCSFAFYDERVHDWKVEPGGFVVTAGNSSRDVRQKVTVTVR